MEYPLQLSFKVFALASQIYIRDGAGNSIGYVKQKMFKLKEKVEVFTDDTRTTPLATIGADRILDWSAAYAINDAGGNKLGVIKRQGMRSIFKAHYLVDGGDKIKEIKEENAWVKVLDGIFGEIPVIGFFAGYLFNPRYLVTDCDGKILLRVKKVPAFWEGRFVVDQHEELSDEDEVLGLMSVMMMLLLERRRG